MLKSFFRLFAFALLATLATPLFGQETVAWANFNGIWDTDHGQMALWQAEDAVWGFYGSHGEIGGHVNNDGLFSFAWDESPDGRGTGSFYLGNDGKTFDGQWIKELDIGEQGTWHGELLGPNGFDIGDRAALDWKPSETQTSPPPETLIELPATETPATETPATETPATETPATETPATETQATETPATETQATETPAAETPQETPATEEPAEEPVQPEYHGDAESAWSGKWDTNLGELDLEVNGVNVTGSFGENGTFEGTIDGATLSGTWTETAEDGSVTNGEAVFWLSEDGVSYRGTYNKSTEPDVWLVWSGHKIIEQEG